MRSKVLFFGLVLLGMLVFVACEKETPPELAESASLPALKAGNGTFSLIAKASMDVGDLDVSIGDKEVTLSFNVDDGWRIKATHVHPELKWQRIPQTESGNPMIGLFDYQSYHKSAVKTYTFTMKERYDNYFYIAAHVEVVYYPSKAFEDAMPDQASLTVMFPLDESNSYFPAMNISGGTILDGSYQGWFADTDGTLSQNTPYDVKVFASTEDLPPGIVDHPENFPYVNWIINQGFVGQESPGGHGAYTPVDVQRAILHFMDHGQSIVNINPRELMRSREIIHAARNAGSDFAPACGDLIAVVLVPESGSQTTIIETVFSGFVEGCDIAAENAWGEGIEFPGDSWAMYMYINFDPY
jgi:hypothetical protein